MRVEHSKHKSGGDLYALYLVGEDGDEEIAFLDLGRNECGRIVGIAIYTGPDGKAQREHLAKYKAGGARLVVYPVTHQELLEAMNYGMPTSVLLDGHKVAASVLKGMLKDALGLPIKNPRVFDLEKVFSGTEEKEEGEERGGLGNV